MIKTRKIYELYDSLSGPTCQSQAYANPCRRIFHVVAVSIKQAIYLCARDTYYIGKGTNGIIEETSGDHRWRTWDGEEALNPRYRHYQTFKD